MSATFDELAECYDRSLPPLPKEYINLMQRCFHLQADDRVVDLGCGSGRLAFTLSRFSSKVEGIDSASEMLRLANERDRSGQVRWICTPVETHEFDAGAYKLIASFEAFHLFHGQSSIIEKCARALKEGGCLCIGWCSYYWEGPFREAILEIFASHRVTWGEWGSQACPFFPEVVRQGPAKFSAVSKDSVEVHESWAVAEVATYLTNSIHHVAGLAKEFRREVARELATRLRDVAGADWTEGTSSYFIMYCSKQG